MSAPTLFSFFLFAVTKLSPVRTISFPFHFYYCLFSYHFLSLFRHNRREALDRVSYGLLQRDPVDAQLLGGLGVVELVDAVDAAAGVVAAGGAVRGQGVGERGEVLAHDGHDLLVGEEAGRHQVAVAAGLGALHGLDVRLGDVAHVDP